MDRARFDALLKDSDFLSQSLFDIIEGQTLLVTELIFALLVAEKMTEEDVRKMVSSYLKSVTDLHPQSLLKFTIEQSASDIEALLSADGPLAAAISLRQERAQGKNPPPPNPI